MEKGLEALDEEIPIKTADLSKLDEFMAIYDRRNGGDSESDSDGCYFSDDDYSDDSYSDDETDENADSDDEKEDKKINV
jgi:hypothetical protein